MPKKWKNLYTTAPIDVEPGDAFAVKIVAVVYTPYREGKKGHWCAYRGPSDWPDEMVATSGDQLPEEQARSVFSVLDRSGLPYYD